MSSQTGEMMCMMAVFQLSSSNEIIRLPAVNTEHLLPEQAIIKNKRLGDAQPST